MINWPLDIAAGIVTVYWLIRFKKLWATAKKDRFNRYFWAFVLVGLGTVIASPIAMTTGEKMTTLGYWWRLGGYWFFYVTAKATKKVDWVKYLRWLGVIWAMGGWIQYFAYPDLRPLEVAGWDPHYKRIFGIFLDPNFMGIMTVLTILGWFFEKPAKSVWLIRAFLLATLAFTYSRGSFLALAGAGAYYAWVRKKFWVIGVMGVIGAVAWFGLPRPGGEGVKLERTASIEGRINNWREGAAMFRRYPLLGVGYNALRYARNQPTKNHAGAGWDNSLLIVATTTGMVGLMVFLIFLKEVWRQKSLIIKLTFLAIIIHSLFVNSLFYPWVMMWGWIVIGSAHLKNPN